MRIFFLINSPFPRYAGGIETWLYNISIRLCYDHKITIVSHDLKYLPILFSNIPDRIKFYKFKTLLSYKLFRPFIRSYLGLIDLIIGSYSMGYLLKKRIVKNEQCYIVALDSLFCVKAGVIAKNERPNAKLIASVRGPHAEIHANSYQFFSTYIYNFEKRMLKQVDTIWANGFDTMANLEIKGFSSLLMRNGIDFEKIVSSVSSNEEIAFFNKGTIKIASVGTLLPSKGIFELIQAVSFLVKRHNINVDAYFIGKGDQEDFKKYALKLEIDQNIHFLGHKENPSIYVKQCDIAACLSEGSGMSMAALECMACGIPIIAWDSPVYHQFNLNHSTMLLVTEKDVNALSDGIIEIINYYGRYLKMASDARSESEFYDWNNICDEFIENLNH
jgi:glycosyltransferase involved in cell wall biosynthesis